MCRVHARDGAEVRGQREDVRARRLPGNDVQNAPEDVDDDVRLREGPPSLVLQQVHQRSEDDDHRVEPAPVLRSFESVAVVCVAAEPTSRPWLFAAMASRRRQGGSNSPQRARQHC